MILNFLKYMISVHFQYIVDSKKRQISGMNPFKKFKSNDYSKKQTIKRKKEKKEIPEHTTNSSSSLFFKIQEQHQVQKQQEPSHQEVHEQNIEGTEGNQRNCFSFMESVLENKHPIQGFEVPSSYEKWMFNQQKQDQRISKPKHRGFYREETPQTQQQITNQNVFISKPIPLIPAYSIQTPEQQKKQPSENLDVMNAHQKRKILKVITFGPSSNFSSENINSSMDNPEQFQNPSNIATVSEQTITSSSNQNPLQNEFPPISNNQYISNNGNIPISWLQPGLLFSLNMLQEQSLKLKVSDLKQTLDKLPNFHQFFPYNQLLLKDITKYREYFLSFLKKIKIITGTLKLLQNRQCILEEKQKFLPQRINSKIHSLKNYFKECNELKSILYSSEKLTRIVHNQKNLFKDVILPQPGKPQCLFMNPDQGMILMVKWIKDRCGELMQFLQDSASAASSCETDYQNIIKSQIEYLHRNASRLMNLKIKIQTLKEILTQRKSIQVDCLFKEKLKKQANQNDWYYYNLIKQCEAMALSQQKKRKDTQ